MARGIGVRYGENGLRSVTVERSGDQYAVSDIAAAPWTGDVHSFLVEHGLPVEDASVAVGLGPGAFLSAFMAREDGMDDADMEELLRWEMGRKILGEPDEWSFGFASEGGTGFLFATRKAVVDSLYSAGTEHPFVDVEPLALSNACQSAGDITNESAIIVSLEAEGVSSIAVDGGLTVAVESFSARREEWIEKLPGLNFIGKEIFDEEAAAQFAKYANGSIARITSRLGNGWKTSRIVLAGGGVYTGNVVEKIAAKNRVPTSIFNPFTSKRVKTSFISPRIASIGSAFTVCFGLAVRAIGE